VARDKTVISALPMGVALAEIGRFAAASVSFGWRDFSVQLNGALTIRGRYWLTIFADL